MSASIRGQIRPILFGAFLGSALTFCTLFIFVIQPMMVREEEEFERFISRPICIYPELMGEPREAKRFLSLYGGIQVRPQSVPPKPPEELAQPSRKEPNADLNEKEWQ